MNERKTACPKCGAENLAWRSRCSACGEELYPDESSVPEPVPRGASFWIACVLGIAGAWLFAFLSLWMLARSLLYVLLFGLVAVPVIALVVCWKRPEVAGILNIIACVLPPAGLFIMVGIDPGESLFVAFGLIFAVLLMFLPLLLSGILLVRSGR